VGVHMFMLSPYVLSSILHFHHDYFSLVIGNFFHF